MRLRSIEQAEMPGGGQRGVEWNDKVLHARILIGDAEIWAADVPNAEPMRSAYLALTATDDAEAERIFPALTRGGQVSMEMQSTFFASRFGQCRDRFRINWMVISAMDSAKKP